MNIQRHLYLSTALRAPDEPAAPEPEVIEQPAGEAVIEPVAEVQLEPQAQLQLEESSAREAETQPKPKPERMISARVFEKTAYELREDKRQQAARADAAERKAADLQAIIERMQADPAAAPAPGTKPAAAAAPPADFNAAVRAQAAKDRLYEDTLTVRSAGETEFADFGESLAILNAIGCTNDDFVSDVLAIDKAGAHKIFDKLAKEPEKAASLVGMDSRRRIAELTRMADAPKTEVKPVADPAPKPAAAAISKAPAPKPSISPQSAAAEVDPTTPEGNEKMTDAEFERWYKGKYQKRA